MKRKLLILCCFLLTLGNAFASDYTQELEQCSILSEERLRIKPSVNRFYFLRHGVSDWNPKMLALGPQDLSLNAVGVEQVIDAVSVLKEKKIDRIITSHLRRCYESAVIISEGLGKIPIEIDFDLEERRFGNWSNDPVKIQRLIDQVEAGPSFFKQVAHIIESMLPLDAESKEEFTLRVVDYFNRLDVHGENVLIISHGCLRSDLIKFLEANNEVGDKQYARPIFFEKLPDNTWHVVSVK